MLRAAMKARTGNGHISLCILLLALAGAVGARAQDADSAPYRRALEAGVRSGAYHAVAAGWLDRDARASWFFGGDDKPDAGSAFELGAVSEVFTGVLLARAAAEGRVRFATPVRELLPDDFVVADPALGALPLVDLATHRAGLPALPPNLMPEDPADPYAGYDELDLAALLANYRRDGPPPASAYSPLDAGLLGYLLGRRYGTSYAQALEEQVLKPLGLRHTGVDDDPALRTGHAAGTVAPHWHFGVLAGAAGLRSTLGDLMDFLAANLHPPASPLRAALLLARQPRESRGPQTAGLSWYLVEATADGQTWPIVWRASVTAGFAAFLGFRTDRQQALVLLGDSDADLAPLGLAWLKHEAAPPPPPAAVAPATIDLAAYPGLYQVRDGPAVIVRANAGTLTAQWQGAPPTPLRALGEDVFAPRDDAFVLSFQREAGVVTSAVASRNGVHVLAQRLSRQAPRLARGTLALAPERLHDYTGDYRVDADTLARISVRDDRLRLQLSGQAAIALAPYAPDRFAADDGSCEASFARDARGAVTAVRVDFAGIERIAPRTRWPVPTFRAVSRR